MTGSRPGERLVHEQDLGVVQDRGDELDLLLVALGQLLRAPVREVLGTEPPQPAAAPRAARGRAGRRAGPPKNSSCSSTFIRGYRPRSSGR